MLDKIIAGKREEIEIRKKEFPLTYLKECMARRKLGSPEDSANFQARSPALDFAYALNDKGIQLIAEVKQASPSRGILCPDFNPTSLAKTYAKGGATAISVLTEANYFKGNIDYLRAIRQEVELPLLRKDFIFDPYQVYESCAYGADALLLIVAILSQKQLEEFLSLSHSFGLRCLVEVHKEKEVERALLSGAQIIGINNRDLDTFVVDIDTTRRLRSFIPQQRIVVAESGITSRNDVQKMKEWGVNAILVGEALVTASDIPAKMRELIL